MFQPNDPLSKALGLALIHEDRSVFLAQAVPCVVANPEFGLSGSSDVEAKLFLTLIFSALPMSSNGFSMVGLSLPSRNDPCPCGSGKKFKKCCVDISNLAMPPSEALFQIALESLSAPDVKKLAEKPSWSLRALGYFLPYLMDHGEVALLVELFTKHVPNHRVLRNEHDFLVALVLDALFDLRLDEARLAFMDELCQQTAAPSLKSIAHQRLAMISAQDGHVAEAQAHLQKAMRADPNQMELPLAEMSTLALIAEEDELISRARFWQARLAKKYGADYPPLETVNQIVLQGKAFFAAMLPDNGWEGDLDFDDRLQSNLDGLLSVLNSPKLNLLYDIKVTSGEAKLMLHKSYKRGVKQWLSLWDEQCNRSDAVVDPEDFDERMLQHEVTFLQLWLMDENGWVSQLKELPWLLSSFEVLMKLTPAVSVLSMVDLENEKASSRVQELKELLAIKKLNLVTTLAGRLLEHEVTLPARLKANDEFWAMAQDCFDFLWDHLDTEDAMAALLEGLVELDPSQAGWLPEAVAMNFFALKQSDKLIAFLADKKRMSATVLLMLACAQQDAGLTKEAVETLLFLHKRCKSDLKRLRQALESSASNSIAQTPFLKLYQTLADESVVHYRQWLINNLPKA